MAKGSYGDQNGKDKPAGKSRRVGKGYDAEFRGYINLNLSDEEKEAHAAWQQSESVWEALDFNVRDGINISLKIDGKGGGFIASATQRREDSPNAGLVVTARGRDPAVAWSRVLFCLTILNHKPRWEDIQPLANPDRW